MQIPFLFAQTANEKEQKLIVGSWREESSKKIRYLFNANGTGVEYFGNNIDSFKYSFSQNLKDCDSSREGTEEGDFYFLKLESMKEKYCDCYLVYGLSQKTLSLSPFARGGVTLFYRMKKSMKISNVQQ